MPFRGNSVRRCRLVHFGPATFIFLFASVLLAACSGMIPDTKPTDSPNILDQVQSIDLLPRSTEPSGSATINRSKDPRAVIYNGSAGNADSNINVKLEGAERSDSGDGYDLNFDSAPVTTVAKVILGDILGVGYIIDPRVQGTVTLTSGRPVPKDDVLYVLESTLRVSNVALVRETNGYRLVPGNEAIGSGSLDIVTENNRPQAGYGISVVPLRYVAAPTLVKLLDSFATKQGAVRVDASQNIILIQGTGSERRLAVETVLNFDKDWMRGQSVGIFPVRHSAPEPIISELEKIMDTGEGGLSQSLVKMQPIARQNAILVVTGKPALLKTAGTWISRLDESKISSTGVKVYRVRYGDARHIAQILNEMFAGGSSSGTIDSSSSQIAPGAGITTASSGAGTSTMTPAERLSGGPAASKQPASANAAFGGNSPALSNSRGASTNGQMFPDLRITADVTNNALLIYANEETYRIIEKTLQQIDRPQLQVAFDATIAEVALNDSLAYGVQFYLQSQNGLIQAINTSGTSANSVGQTVPGFNFTVGVPGAGQIILNALHTVADTKILSNPSLVVVDNGVATLNVGDQVPIATATSTVLNANGAVVNTISYQPTGIILRVSPRVGFNNTITLDIEQEISSVTGSGGVNNTPTISQRKVKSTLAIADGQTVLLAGLIIEKLDKPRTGIPILDQLPGYLGDAFSQQSKTTSRTELIILIRPQIIRDAVDAHLIAEGLRAKLKSRIGEVSPQSPQGTVPISAR